MDNLKKFARYMVNLNDRKSSDLGACMKNSWSTRDESLHPCRNACGLLPHAAIAFGKDPETYKVDDLIIDLDVDEKIAKNLAFPRIASNREAEKIAQLASDENMKKICEGKQFGYWMSALSNRISDAIMNANGRDIARALRGVAADGEVNWWTVLNLQDDKYSRHCIESMCIVGNIDIDDATSRIFAD